MREVVGLGKQKDEEREEVRKGKERKTNCGCMRSGQKKSQIIIEIKQEKR